MNIWLLFPQISELMRTGVVYHKNADDYPAGEILYDSDTSRTDIIGMADNEGDAIDIVGNLREDR